jgi:hypothetical protein
MAREHDLNHSTNNGNTMPTPNKTTIVFDLSIKVAQKIFHYSCAQIWRRPEQSTQGTASLTYGLRLQIQTNRNPHTFTQTPSIVEQNESSLIPQISLASCPSQQRQESQRHKQRYNLETTRAQNSNRTCSGNW